MYTYQTTYKRGLVVKEFSKSFLYIYTWSIIYINCGAASVGK